MQRGCGMMRRARLVGNTQMLKYLVDAIASDSLVILHVYPEYPEMDVLGN
jgi:hypothetical protein